MFIESLLHDRRTGKILPPKRPTTAEVDDDLIELPAVSQEIWRYMAYEKFVDLVQSRQLYCRRLDKLPDALEGLLSAGNCWQMSPVMQGLHDGYNIQENHDEVIIQSEPTRRCHFVNCWHINDSESRTMWRLYAPTDESVAIISRVVTLRAYAQACLRYRLGRVIPSKVKYVDFNYPRPDWVSWGPALFKDLAFRFEREVRLIAIPAWPIEEIMRNDSWKIPVDATPLIEKVILHPHAHSGFYHCVKNLIHKNVPHVPLAKSSIRSRLW